MSHRLTFGAFCTSLSAVGLESKAQIQALDSLFIGLYSANFCHSCHPALDISANVDIRLHCQAVNSTIFIKSFIAACIVSSYWLSWLLWYLQGALHSRGSEADNWAAILCGFLERSSFGPRDWRTFGSAAQILWICVWWPWGDEVRTPDLKQFMSSLEQCAYLTVKLILVYGGPIPCLSGVVVMMSFHIRYTTFALLRVFFILIHNRYTCSSDDRLFGT